MFNDRPIFWSIFVSTAVVAFLPLVIVLAFFYATSGLQLLLIIIAAFVVLALPGAALVARSISNPLQSTTKSVQSVAEIASTDDKRALASQIDRLVSVDGPEELQTLSQALRDIVTVLQERLNQLDSIYDMSQTVTQALDYDAALEAILEAVSKVVDYDAAEVIVRVDGQLQSDAWRGAEGLIDTTGRKYSAGKGLVGTIAATKESLLMSEITESSTDSRRTLAAGAAIQEMLQRTNKLLINSFMGIPLLVKGELIGAITVVHRDRLHFQPHDQEQLEMLAAQASIAINNALTVRQREEGYRMQIRELQIRIDEAQRNKEVDAVVSSDYFKSLREQAHTMRQAARIRRKRP